MTALLGGTANIVALRLTPDEMEVPFVSPSVKIKLIALVVPRNSLAWVLAKALDPLSHILSCAVAFTELEFTPNVQGAFDLR